MSQDSESIDIEGEQIPILIDDSRLQDIEPIYANYVQLIPTNNEIVINFGRIDPPRIDPESLDTDTPVTLVVKPVMRVVLPHSVFDSFAQLVARQHTEFARQIGKLAQRLSGSE